MVLDAIARRGSLAGAGRALQWSQPTVTHHLAALERELEAPVVRRGPNGCTLTPLGEMVLEHCAAILQRANRMKSEAADFQGRESARLHLGVIPTIGARLLPQALGELEEHFTVVVTEAENERLNEDVLGGNIDIALVTSGPLLNEHGQKTRVGSDQLLLVVPENSPLAERTEVSIAELAEQRWIFARSSDDAADRALVYTAKAAGFEVQVAKRSDNYATVIGYVRANFGIALLPELATELISSGVRVIPVVPRIDRTIWVVSRPGLPSETESYVAGLFHSILDQRAWARS